MKKNINEIGNTLQGQKALSAVLGRAQERRNEALGNDNEEGARKYNKTCTDAEQKLVDGMMDLNKKGVSSKDISDAQMQGLRHGRRKHYMKESFGDSDYAISERAEEIIRNAYDFGQIEEGDTWEDVMAEGRYSDMYQAAENLSDEFDINVDMALNYLQKAFNNYEDLYESKNMKKSIIKENLNNFYSEEDSNGKIGQVGQVKSYDCGYMTESNVEIEAKESGYQSIEEYLKSWWNEVSTETPFTWETLGKGYGYHGNDIFTQVEPDGGILHCKEIFGQIMFDVYPPQQNEAKKSKQTMKLNESELQKMISESVKKHLNEFYSVDDYEEDVFTPIDSELSKLGEVFVSRFYSDESNAVVAVKKELFLEVKEEVKNIMSGFNYKLYDIGCSESYVMMTFKPDMGMQESKNSKKNNIKLTENSLKAIVTESLKNILKEGMTSDNPYYEKWETIKEKLGTEQMLLDIFNYLDSSQLEQIIEWFNQDYDFFNDEENEDEDLENYME